MAVFDSAVRMDGASHGCAAPKYPAVASHYVVTAAIAAAEQLDLPYHVGPTRSADTFCARHPRPGSSFGNFWPSSWQDHFEDPKRLSVLGAEMEASLIFVLARIWGLRAGGMSVVLDNVLGVSGDSGVFGPEDQFDHGDGHIAILARLARAPVFALHQSDNGASS